MKIFINTSNLYHGGGVQVALSFVNELKSINSTNSYYVILSKEIDKQIEKNNFPKIFKFYLVKQSPSSLKTRKKVVKILDAIESEINPDIVFTVFGPSYWKPKTKHLMGFADGWVYNPTSVAYNKLPFIKRMKMKLATKYKLYYLNRDAEYYVLETQDAINKLSKIMNEDISKFFVVGNTFSNVFNEKIYLDSANDSYIKLPKKSDDEFRFIYIAHNHPAKNLSIINKLIPYIKDYNIKFVLTLDDNSFDNLFKDQDAEKFIINIGPIPLTSCPSVYEQCDALFAPTLLETFSAAYPEAMKMEKPIFTSDFSFTRDICHKSAIYFDALNPEEISMKMIDLVNNKTLQDNLISKGLLELNNFETAKSRAEKYLSICKEIKENK